jgi:Ni/Co efflux regulator RcnB
VNPTVRTLSLIEKESFMLNKTLLCASIVAFATAGVTAHAQDRDHDQWHNGRAEQRDNDRRDNDRHDNARRDYGHQGNDARRMGGPERHHWARGERLPDQYRHGGYVDWRARRLHAPPRGYQWVDVDGDYVLVALTTGLIADMIINSR